jgi:p-aminobenzoyl-glutamate transporter AbgT
LTRHPKKKEEEKSAPDDPNVKDLPPSEPTMTQTSGLTKNPIGTLFWIRIGLGVLAGIISAFAGNAIGADSKAYVGFGIMIILFIISYGIAKAMHIPLPPSDKKKLIMTGIGSYFFIFIFTWILVNTLIHPAITGIPIK